MDQVTLAKTQMRAENWRTLIQNCQQSGQTVVNWCDQNNINIKTYYYWLRKLRKLELDGAELPALVPEETPVAFRKLEVQTPVANTQAAVIIHFLMLPLRLRKVPVSRLFRQCFLHCRVYVRRHCRLRKHLYRMRLHGYA